MYTETQLEAIKLFGKKDLSFGCIVYADKWVTQKLPLIGTSCIIWVTSDEWEIDTIETYMKPYKDHEWSSWNDSLSGFMSTYTILWHIPHWHNLFSALRDKWLESFLWSESLLIDPDEKMWKKKNIEVNKYIPLLDQPEATLKELLALFQ